MPQPRFVSEPIVPDKDTFDTAAMVTGEPGMPEKFSWRKKDYEVAEVVKKWKSTSPCYKHPGSEQYVRRHWFRVRTAQGPEMDIYFERKPRSGRELKKRWWVATITQNR